MYLNTFEVYLNTFLNIFLHTPININSRKWGKTPLNWGKNNFFTVYKSISFALMQTIWKWGHIIPPQS